MLHTHTHNKWGEELHCFGGPITALIQLGASSWSLKQLYANQNDEGCNYRLHCVLILFCWGQEVIFGDSGSFLPLPSCWSSIWGSALRDSVSACWVPGTDPGSFPPRRPGQMRRYSWLYETWIPVRRKKSTARCAGTERVKCYTDAFFSFLVSIKSVYDRWNLLAVEMHRLCGK